ncbi:Flp pilus assembly protein CpaB [Klenkia brasiliensis]|uniref:Flp pilus assembly protein CpaB n=1 Tax=Klenkia brasiliensis TaxID=333142 RepID=A0A1G7LT20_9ACTN|nr:Flp pilus assembly protein CpaB [Klenkia brasiliensis]SDF52698.1 Flp pilus assembly protein CpaB [Klenkia brasiliensis]
MHLPPLRRPRHPAHTLRRVAAGLLALLALALALRPAPAAPGAPAVAGVVVAGADLPAGRPLGADDLVTAEWPTGLVPDGAARDPAELTGAVLAAPVRRGEPVTDARVVGPGLWARVPQGQVAAPVRLADLAVAALLRAGDRVDVLATTSDGDTRVVAAGALVLAAPPEGPDPGLLVLAVAETTAAELATATTQATLSATLGPP